MTDIVVTIEETPIYISMAERPNISVEVIGPGIAGITQEQLDQAFYDHKAESDPHMLYLTPTEANNLYPAKGTVAPLNQSVIIIPGAAYTPALVDNGKLIKCTSATPVTVTLPTDTTAAFPVGARVDFLASGDGMITFVAQAGATAIGTPSLITRAKGSAASAIKDAANAWTVVGDFA